MRHRWRAALGAMVAGAALTATVAAISLVGVASASVAPVCGPAGARTVAQSGGVRVYDAGEYVWACAAGHHHALRLGFRHGCGGGSSGCSGVRAIRVAGGLVAYATYEADGAFNDADFTLRVRDVRTG